jgi:NAD(P)-dependent dehydrogenase (short-subunit alcohol dehydrogenase family)
MRLKDKVAIITGGGTGIGQDTAFLFAEEGAKVVVADVNPDTGPKTVSQIQEKKGESIFVQADISKETEAKAITDQTLEAFGKIDILVNNAAIFILKGLAATVEEWQRSLGVNVIGTALCTKYAVDAMKKNGKGAIVNLSSISGWIAQPEFITYGSTKAAIVQMTRHMALDLAPFNIRANCVCPGSILTPICYEVAERTGTPVEELLAVEGAKHVLNRLGQPREVAYAILFLASDESSFITGTHLMVDGGYTLR